MHHRRSENMPAAFSLVELIIVISIMAVVAAIAIPRYANAIVRYRSEAAARRVAADLEYASGQARQLSKPVVVTFNTSAGTYAISGVESLSHRAGGYSVNLAAEPYRAAISTITFGATSITFNIYGKPNVSGKVVVTCGASTNSAVLDDATGKATVQ